MDKLVKKLSDQVNNLSDQARDFFDYRMYQPLPDSDLRRKLEHPYLEELKRRLRGGGSIKDNMKNKKELEELRATIKKRQDKWEK